MRGGVFGRPDGAIVTTKAAMDELLARANGDVSLIEYELGTENWVGKDIYRTDIDNPLDYNPRLVDEKMTAANKFHLAKKNKTIGGQTEIALDKVPDVQLNPNIRTSKVIANGVTLPSAPSSQPMIQSIKEPIPQE